MINSADRHLDRQSPEFLNRLRYTGKGRREHFGQSIVESYN